MAQKVSVARQIMGLQSNFWIANVMEAFERLAFFGARAILPLYMVASVAENGLGLSFTQKGLIYSIWALIQCLVPMVSGGFTDQYGYRKSLFVAFTINIAGYLTFAFATGFWSSLAAACLIGLGTAIFKPPVQGTIAKASTDENSSIAWGLFYWIVNVGGFLAPILAAILRGETNWQLVFFCAAGVTAFNFIPAIFFYKEPPVDPSHKIKSVGETFLETITTLKDWNFLIFLGIFSGFWFMFMQLWDLLPNFIDEWVFSRDVAPVFTFMFGWLGDVVLPDGNVKPEMMINIDSFSIILFMLPIAWLTGKFHPMIALIGGMIISLVGFMMSGGSNIGWVVAMAIFIFSIGEMWCSPKFSEYIGLTAPPDKKALYMGYSNIPFAVGWGVGNAVSGPLYDSFGSKEHFAREYLVDHLGVAQDTVASIRQEQVMDAINYLMNNDTGMPLMEYLDRDFLIRFQDFPQTVVDHLPMESITNIIAQYTTNDVSGVALQEYAAQHFLVGTSGLEQQVFEAIPADKVMDAMQYAMTDTSGVSVLDHISQDYLVGDLGMSQQVFDTIPHDRILDVLHTISNGITDAAAVRLDSFQMVGDQIQFSLTPQVMDVLEATARYTTQEVAQLEHITRILWDLNNPWTVWVILTAVGSLSTLLMLFYYFKTRGKSLTSNGNSAQA